MCRERDRCTISVLVSFNKDLGDSQLLVIRRPQAQAGSRTVGSCIMLKKKKSKAKAVGML